MKTRHNIAVGALAGASLYCAGLGHIEPAIALVCAAGIVRIHRSIVEDRELERQRMERVRSRATNYIELRGLSPQAVAEREAEALEAQRDAARRVIEQAKRGLV